MNKETARDAAMTQEVCGECGHDATVHRYLNGRNWCAGSPGDNQAGGLICPCAKYQPGLAQVTLSPCPFCGGEATMHAPGEDTFWAGCEPCEIGFKYFYTPLEAAEIWNKRSPEIAAAQSRIQELETALREIAKGEGRFSRDPLTHATNTIEDMTAIAKAALGEL